MRMGERDRIDLFLCMPSTEKSPRLYRLSQEAGRVRREFQSSEAVPNNVQACSLYVSDDGVSEIPL